jgi:hypothetical protein
LAAAFGEGGLGTDDLGEFGGVLRGLRDFVGGAEGLIVAMFGSSTVHVGFTALVANITLKVAVLLKPEWATFGESPDS